MSHQIIKDLLQDSADTKQRMLQSDALITKINEAATRILRCAKSKGLIMACGNGGSTCDAMHLTEELVARYKRERPGIRAMHLMDPSIMTCWSNDYEFAGVFSRQVETFGKTGDLLIAFSTSGNSENIIKAVETSKRLGVETIALTGKDGGKLLNLADTVIVVPSKETERIQEAHITLVHIFCEIIERTLYS